jgi:hypothetical protein
MLPFLKKKSEASAPSVPAWHPNFRNYEKLPDIKVVRTAFFINGAAIFAALALLTYFGIQEWKLRAVTMQVNDWQKLIDRDKKSSEAAKALYKKFQDEEARINEVEAFVKSKPTFSPIIVRLAEILPANIALDTVDLRDVSMIMRISIRGQSAGQVAQNYVELLQKDPQLITRFENIRLTSTPTRNPTTGRTAAEIQLDLKGAKK